MWFEKELGFFRFGFLFVKNLNLNLNLNMRVIRVWIKFRLCLNARGVDNSYGQFCYKWEKSHDIKIIYGYRKRDDLFILYILIFWVIIRSFYSFTKTILIRYFFIAICLKNLSTFLWFFFLLRWILTSFKIVCT